MKITILFSVVALQVLVFQFLAARFARVLPELQVGVRDLPAEVTAAVRAHVRRATLVRYPLGALLWLAALLLTFVLPLDVSNRKLGLALLSLASSAIFAVMYLLDRRALDRIAAHLPSNGVRSAMLARRSLSRHYSPLWDVLAAALCIATIILTLWALPRIAAGTAAGGDFEPLLFWILPFFQVTYLVFVYLLGLRLARRPSCLPQRSRAFLGSPEEAVALDDALRTLQLRALLMVKIALVLVIGLWQLRRVLEALGRPAGTWLPISTWVLIAAILVVYGIVMMQMQKVRRECTHIGS